MKKFLKNKESRANSQEEGQKSNEILFSFTSKSMFKKNRRLRERKTKSLKSRSEVDKMLLDMWFVEM